MKYILLLSILIAPLPLPSDAHADEKVDLCSQKFFSMTEQSSDYNSMLKQWISIGEECEGTGFYEYKLGQLYIQTKEYIKAQKAFDSGLKHSTPWGKDISLSIGDIYLHQAEYSSAEKHYRKIIDNYPSWNEGYHSLGFSLFAQGSYSEAVDYLEKANSIQESAKTYRHLVLCYYSLKSYEKSVAALKASAKLDASILADRDPMLVGARAAAELGDFHFSKKLLILLLGYVPESIEDEDYIKAGLFLQKKMEMAGLKYE